MNVLFLDIDGVLLPFGNDDDDDDNSGGSDGKKRDTNNNVDNDGNTDATLFPNNTLDALSYLVRKIPSLCLVLSSTWRVYRENVLEIQEAFEKYGDSLSACQFHDTTNPKLHSERQYEIQDWIDKQQHAKQQMLCWVALDDEELLVGKANAKFRHLFEGHVVKTDSKVGLTLDDAQQAVQLFRAQQQQKQQKLPKKK